MTIKQAMAFKLANGTTVGQASPEDWREHTEIVRRVDQEFDELDESAMTAEDRQRLQASCNRARALNEALSIVKEHLRKCGKPTW